MFSNFYEYSFIFLFLFLSLSISSLIFTLSYIFIPQQINYQKLNSYECGFSPFEDSRIPFSIKFYLIAILFLIFDLEVTLLFPWALVINQIHIIGFYYILIFLVILTLGFIYEWYKGALEWE